MKIAIVGTRSPKINYSEFKEILQSLINDSVDTIVSGGAKGIDSYAHQYAIENNLSLVEFLPEYNKYGKSAPFIRNSLIIENSDEVLAFPSDSSKGTYDSIRKANKLNKPLKIYKI